MKENPDALTQTDKNSPDKNLKRNTKSKKPCVFQVTCVEPDSKGETEGKNRRLGDSLPKEPTGLIAGDFAALVGTVNVALADEVISRGADAMPQNRNRAHNLNVQLQSLNDLEPQDVIEARLVAQMTVLHAQGMEYLRKAENSEMLCHLEAYQKVAIKLLRLQNETIDTLMRYRRGGEQRVVVQHVNVSNGGQAVVTGSMEKSDLGANNKN